MTTYTGHSTKIMKNSVKAKPKRSKVNYFLTDLKGRKSYE